MTLSYFTDHEFNNHCVSLAQYAGGRIIPLDYFHSNEWIQYGLISKETRDFFLEFPYSEYETAQYKIIIRRVDDLINLRIYKLESK